MLIGVDRKHLAFAPARELGFHFFDQCPLFCICFALVQINRFGNDERFAAFGFRVKFRPVKVPKPFGLSGHASSAFSMVLATLLLPRCSFRQAVISSSSSSYAVFRGSAIATGTTS